MDLTTALILITIYVVIIAISMFIDDRMQKIYYFMIVALGSLVFINVYLSVIYYIKLRNEPGIPGPRGSKGARGPTGSNGKCKISDKCGFTADDADKILYETASQTFETSKSCLKDPTLETCNGGASEVERIKPVNQQIKMLEDLAQQGLFTKQEFEAKIKNTLGNL